MFHLFRLLKKDADVFKAVRGNRGYWHGTYGTFGYIGRRTGVWTFCYEAISPQDMKTDAKEARVMVKLPKVLK